MAKANDPPKERTIPNGLKFLFGGSAGMLGTCVVLPLDLVKTRMQLSGGGQSSFTVTKDIIAREGIFSLSTGLSAGLLHQATYTTTRLGIYTYLFDLYKDLLGTCVVQPLDLVKTRMQLRGDGQSSFTVAKDIIAREGFFSLYTGLSAGLLHQATYTTTRLGIYTYPFDLYKERYSGENPGVGTKMFLGVTVAGFAGAFVGTPAEVALIRMTADGRLPKEQSRNYKSVVDALLRIVKEEGVLKLWRGASPTVLRATVVNAAQLGTYSQAREMFIHYIPDAIFLHFCASMTSGLVATIASMPVDIIKARIQNAAKGEGQVAVVTSLLRNEGVFSLWKGFLPYYARMEPHTVLTFIFYFLTIICLHIFHTYIYLARFIFRGFHGRHGSLVILFNLQLLNIKIYSQGFKMIKAM